VKHFSGQPTLLPAHCDMVSLADSSPRHAVLNKC
jgi:hypothetical protein